MVPLFECLGHTSWLARSGEGEWEWEWAKSAAICHHFFLKISKYYRLDLYNDHAVQGIHTDWGTPSLQPFAACCPQWGRLGPYREDRHGAWTLPARHHGPSYLVRTIHIQWSCLAVGVSHMVTEVVRVDTFYKETQANTFSCSDSRVLKFILSTGSNANWPCCCPHLPSLKGWPITHLFRTVINVNVTFSWYLPLCLFVFNSYW